MRTKKSTAALRPSPLVVDDVFLSCPSLTPSSRPLSTGPPSPLFSAAAFDQYMSGEVPSAFGGGGDASNASVSSRNASGGGKEGGLGKGKKLLSFPWTRKEAKQSQQLPFVVVPPATAAVAAATPSADSQILASSLYANSPPSPTGSSLPPSPRKGMTGASSLPLGFPTPPPHAHAAALREQQQQQQQQQAAAVQHRSFVGLFSADDFPSSTSVSTPPHPHPHSHSHGQQHSNSSLSTFRTTSSFASTALFHSSPSTNDGWESEATSLSASLTSSPESGRDSDCGGGGGMRMWRVKGLKAEAATAGGLPVLQEEREDRLSGCYDGVQQHYGSPTRSTRRNSTPIPSYGVGALMLASPETPPRPKRFSTSSIGQISPNRRGGEATTTTTATSPPFDLAFEMAAAARRRREESGESGNAGGDDADDEVSPPRYLNQQRRLSSSAFGASRIPSIRFEGLSMDAVFAEVEKKLAADDEESEAVEAAAAAAVARSREELRKQQHHQQRRRSRVLSTYKPLSYGDEAPTTSMRKEARKETPPPLPTTSSSRSLASLASLADSALSLTSSTSAEAMDALRSSSVTPTAATAFPSTTLPAQPLDAPRPRPYPRRTSSRPLPLNVDVAAANAISAWCGPASAPLQAAEPLYSPTVAGASGFFSPPLAGAFSSVSSPTIAALSPSPVLDSPSSLGEPFTPTLSSSHMDPSPALSSTSTFRPPPSPSHQFVDIPELLVCPPSPTQDELDRAAAAEKASKQRRSRAPAAAARRVSVPPPEPMVSGPTRVTVVQEKKMVRVSTRAGTSSRRPPTTTHYDSRRATAMYASPPLQHVSVFPSPSSYTYSPVSSRAPSPAPTTTTPRAPSPSPPTTPTITVSPSFSIEAYTPSSVARTDFHPALDSRTVVAALSAPPSPAKSLSSQMSGESSSDCEEQFHTMLMRLNRPHTPPDVEVAVEGEEPTTSESLSLTSLALELHNTSQSRLSMLAREMGNVVGSSSTPSPAPSSPSRSATPAGKENLPVSLSPSSSSLSLSLRRASTRQHRRSKLYPSSSPSFASASSLADQDQEEEEQQQYGDAPLSIAIAVARPLCPLVRHQSLAARSSHGELSPVGASFSDEEEGGFPADEQESHDGGEHGGMEGDVDIESEIERQLANMSRGSGSGSGMSVFSDDNDTDYDCDLPRRRDSHPPPSSAPTATAAVAAVKSHHKPTDSISSFSSSSSFGFTAPPTRRHASPAPGALPRSESANSTFTDSSFDDEEMEEDLEGVVCLGERVSCTYDVGVIGVAM